MKVLVATSEGQGLFDDDYGWTVDGELVYVQGVTCSNPKCGCDRGFAGMSSSRATTTAKVVDRPDYTMADYRGALVDSLTRGGWIEEGDQTAETARFVSDVFSFLMWITEHAEVGCCVRRRGDEILFDRPAAAA